MTLDELDALHAAATAGEWQRAPASGRILADGWPVPMSDPANTAAIVALKNNWHAFSARLRAAEAEAERLRAALAPFAAFAATLPPVVDESRLTDSGAIASGAVFADPAKAPLRFITYADVRRARAALGEP